MGIAIVICPVTIGYNVYINILTPLIVPQDKFFGYFAQIEPSIKFFSHIYIFLNIYPCVCVLFPCATREIILTPIPVFSAASVRLLYSAIFIPVKDN